MASVGPLPIKCHEPTVMALACMPVSIDNRSARSDPETIDLATFPALRKIQIRSRDWPTTEREISKSDLVKMAEALMKKNITLLDSTGKSWIPRMKSIRTKR
ncbi:hypothetical protein B0H17DRAFT_1335397 [Mycena rosella]|uniref:Uncharacterized protein n=1 Tax=Mycena rosella TaxID=1033263 RepID=A0AAD7CZM0_MYCRO|nr:hypothetical protein B0H17DRAFT_1335397 [Mycena rosella]